MMVKSPFLATPMCLSTGVDQCPNVSHHPTIGDISSQTDDCFGDVQNPQKGTFANPHLKVSINGATPSYHPFWIGIVQYKPSSLNITIHVESCKSKCQVWSKYVKIFQNESKFCIQNPEKLGHQSQPPDLAP